MLNADPHRCACLLCQEPGGTVLWQDDFARVVLVGDADHPGFCRVIANRHVMEMTDLEAGARDRLMRIVYQVEQALRELLQPDKINLASLGNQVPHLHWHVIPRFRDDPHFPNPVWGPRSGGQSRTVDAEFGSALSRRLNEGLG